ncbi:MAG: TVP38/TMEM64 family protein [Candidatus Viridilinea halotolerans]|uniref:TVP38/TMEM64 family membrane protein n=1 Tax=Candidatus Viridilinea halotolerans TaxID=2491704 RepID=A0A426U197_9CHLR|nr:MAG: TVP38/TMEM64 family protein [Candidatus Viridilinea halotolerans]
MLEQLPSPPLAARPTSWLARHWQKLVAAAIWLTLAGCFLGYSLVTGSTPTATLQSIIDLLRTPLGPLLYILIYTLRPLAFFSAIIVTLLGGAIWGPVWGTVFVVIGSNMSATLAYGFGRIFGQGVLATGAPAASAGVVHRYAERLRANAFSTILVMRLIFLPYDLVNYLAGFLRVPYRPFVLASILGSLPGTLTFVLAGAALDIDDIFAGNVSVAAINPWMLGLSAILFAGGIAIARLLKRREGVEG